MACTAAALTEQQADRFFDRRRVVSQVKSDDFFGKIFRTFCVFWPEIFGSFWAFFFGKICYGTDSYLTGGARALGVVTRVAGLGMTAFLACPIG